MNRALVIDNEWDTQKSLYQKIKGLNDNEIVGFSNPGDAISWLNSLDPDQLPTLYVFDSVGSIVTTSNLITADYDFGKYAAKNIAALLQERGLEQGRTFIFKSADKNLALRTADWFQTMHPDFPSGTLTPGKDYAFGIDDEQYIPVVVPGMVKEFLNNARRTHPIFMYEKFRDQIAPIHASWETLDTVEGKELSDFSEFSFGAGKAKNGLALFSLDDLETLPTDKKAVLFCDQIPGRIFQSASRLSAIVMTGQSDILGHLRILLAPYDISLLVGSNDKENIIETLTPFQPVTLIPHEKKLYFADLNIISIDNAMPRLVPTAQEMNLCADNEIRRISEKIPQFEINVSSAADLKQLNHRPRIGITRTEHFFSPFMEPEQWDHVSDFLIGKGAELRRTFARAGDKHADLLKKKQQYNDLYKSPLPFPSIIGDYDYDDTVRLPDIPPEEFFTNKDDLDRFENLYGKNIRGVQLAKKIPDMYVNFLRGFMGYDQFQVEGPPQILIPAVQTGEDIEFVKDCIRKALPDNMVRMVSLGSMIETLQACDNIEDIASKVSSLKIGSNDLTAELHKASRSNKNDIGLFTSLTPEIIETIKSVVDRARQVNPHIHICLCGEAATNPQSLMALRDAGIWFDSFSVPPTFKDSNLLPLLYKDMILENFCGPKNKADENFYIGRSPQ
ncbi:MAG: aldolase/citrate lyase family protein [Alphaproteobacteria bacterium]